MLPKIKKLTFVVEFQQLQSPYQGRTGDPFLNKFQQLRQALTSNLQEFVTVQVLPRQPPSHLMSVPGRFNRNVYLDPRKNKIVEFPRRNSFEIYVDNFHLFSRLETGTWPDINTICEWALRVAEKLVDIQIQKEEGPLKEQLQLIGKDIPIEEASNNQKLPPVSRGFDQTLRNRPEKGHPVNYYPRSRYSSLREEDGLMPYGIDAMNHTQKMPFLNRSTKTRMKVKSIDKELRTMSRNVYQRPRDQSFHWDIKQKGSAPKFTSRRNDALINTFDGGRTPNIELSPLPAVHDRFRQQIQQELVNLPRTETIQLKLSENALNCYKKYYRTDGDRAIKISGDQLWSPLLCQTPLPLIGQYSFQIFVQSSCLNQVQLGIAPISYYPNMEQPEKADNLITFNCGNGKIKDAKLNNFASQTHWRQGGIKTACKPPFCLKAIVNTKNKLIEWHVNDTISASAKIPSQYNAGFRAFVSLYNCRDSISLNRPADTIIQSLQLLHQLKEQIKGRQKVTANAFVQTGEANEVSPETPKQVIQHRIYPNFRQKEIAPMINQVTQTTPIIEGRIKKQRLHRFIEKNESERQKEKQKEIQKDFTVEDVKTYKAIIANEQNNCNNNEWNINIPQEEHKPNVVVSIIDVKIQETQSIEEIEKKINAQHKQHTINQQQLKKQAQVQETHQIIHETLHQVEEPIKQQLKQQLKTQEIIDPAPIITNEQSNPTIQNNVVIQQQTSSNNHPIPITQQIIPIKTENHENHQPQAIQKHHLPPNAEQNHLPQAVQSHLEPPSTIQKQQPMPTIQQKQKTLQIIEEQFASANVQQQQQAPIIEQRQEPLQVIQVEQTPTIIQNQQLAPVIIQKNQQPAPIQSELKQNSESGEIDRWQGVYQQGSFKLKPIHHQI